MVFITLYSLCTDRIVYFNLQPVQKTNYETNRFRVSQARRTPFHNHFLIRILKVEDIIHLFITHLSYFQRQYS